MIPACCRCFEEFTLAEPHTQIRMGLLFPLSRMPPRFQGGYPPGSFMCGNCYHDLFDAEEEHDQV